MRGNNDLIAGGDWEVGGGGGNQPLTCHVQMLEFRVTMTIFFW